MINRTRSNPIIRVLRALRAVILSFALVLLVACAISPDRSHGGADFTVSTTPGSQAVAAGTTASYTLTFNPPALVAAATFSISGAPAGTQASLSQDSDIVNGTKTLNVLTTTDTPPGTSEITVTASDSTGSQTVRVGLTIKPAADFKLSVTPGSQTVLPGASATYMVNVTFTGNATGPVSLSVDGLPAEATASFDPASLSSSGTSTLVITAGPQIGTQTSKLQVVTMDSSGTLSAEISFSTVPADFSLDQNVGPIELNAGVAITGQINASQLIAGTPGTITLSASGLPPGVTAAFNPGAIGGFGTSIITIRSDVSTAPGPYNLEIDGTDASGTNFTIIPILVAPGNPAAGFFLTVSPFDQTIDAGGNLTLSIEAMATKGTLPPLTFTTSSNLSGVDANVVPANRGLGTFDLDVAVSPSVDSSDASVSVTANGPNGTQTVTVHLTINLPSGP